MTQLDPLVEDMDPRLRPGHEEDVDLATVELVVNTHLHVDHCGGNDLVAGKPVHVQHRELELLPGIRAVPAPGHTDGNQGVVVETGGRPVVIAGAAAVRFAELDEPRTERVSG